MIAISAYCGKHTDILEGIAIMSEVQDALVEALENPNNPTVKEYLTEFLASTEKPVMDESIFKRKRGRPRKDESADSLIDLPEGEYSRKIMLAEKKAKARKQDRINPLATKEEREKQDLLITIRELTWDLEESPGKDADFKELEDEIKVLRKEAGIPKLNESYEPYAAFVFKAKEFKEWKSNLAEYLANAKEAAQKGDLRRGREFSEYVKVHIPRLEDDFKAIQDSFDALCEYLCAKADHDKGGRGLKNPDSLEVEKFGYGMMDGENYEVYAKRMRAIGLGREIPRTIRETDKEVEATERRWRSVAGLSQAEFSAVKVNWQETFRRLLKKCMIGSPMKIAGLNRLLVYGMDFGESDMGHGILLPMNPFVTKNPMGSQYGEIYVKWKPHKAVATMLCGDSIFLIMGGHNYVCPSFLTNPSPCSFSPECRGFAWKLRKEQLDIGIETLCDLAQVPYVELQLHGNEDHYGAEAIDSILFSSEYEVCNLSMEALEAIEEFDIPLYLKDERITIEDGKIMTAEEKEQEKQRLEEEQKRQAEAQQAQMMQGQPPTQVKAPMKGTM